MQQLNYTCIAIQLGPGVKTPWDQKFGQCKSCKPVQRTLPTTLLHLLIRSKLEVVNFLTKYASWCKNLQLTDRQFFRGWWSQILTTTPTWLLASSPWNPNAELHWSKKASDATDYVDHLIIRIGLETCYSRLQRCLRTTKNMRTSLMN